LSKVIIYTKGVSSGNSKEGIGGWAAIMLYGEHKKEITGGIQNATNNVSEMTAIINALSLLKDPCEVDVFTGFWKAMFIAFCILVGYIIGKKIHGKSLMEKR
jgi:ribonuclease HI